MRLLKLMPLVAAASASAATITFNATITSGPDRVGESVSVTYVTTDNPAATQSGGAYIDESFSSDKDLFASISGTGITGNWTRPFDPAADSAPYSAVQRSTFLCAVLAASDTAQPIALSFFGNPIHNINFAGWANLPAVTGGDYSTLFTGASGSYTAGAGSAGFIGLSSTFYNLAVTSFTINAAPPVPEPSTYGLALGGLALVGAIIRRRKVSK